MRDEVEDCRRFEAFQQIPGNHSEEREGVPEARRGRSDHVRPRQREYPAEARRT